MYKLLFELFLKYIGSFVWRKIIILSTGAKKLLEIIPAIPPDKRR